MPLGSGSGSAYPAALDTKTTYVNDTVHAILDDSQRADAEFANDVQDGLVKIETELGSNPSDAADDTVAAADSAADVKAKLNMLLRRIKEIIGGSGWKTAVPYSLSQGNTRMYNVLYYGALGNGTNDDTAAIQAAINAAKAAGGGIVFFPPGTYKVSSLNCTAIANVHLIGSGRQATILAPSTNGVHVLDLTGATGVTLQNFTLGTGSGQTAVPITALFIALNNGGVGNLIHLVNLSITGAWSTAAVYVYGMTLVRFTYCDVYNYQAGLQNTLVLDGTNAAALSSTYATVAAGTKIVASVDFFQGSIQQWGNNSGAIQGNNTLKCNQAFDIHLWGTNLVNNKGTQWMEIAGTCARFILDGVVFDPGGATAPTYGIALSSGTLSGLSLNNCNPNQSSTFFSTGGGAVNAGTGNHILSGRTIPGTNQTAGTTWYLGPAGHSTADDAGAAFLIPSRGVLNTLYLQATAPPGAGKNFTFTVEVNGSDSALTAQMSGAGAVTANDLTHRVGVNPGDRVSFKSVSDAGAASAQMMACVGLLPY